MLSKIWVTILCFLLVLSFLVGCGGKKADISPGNFQTKPQAASNQTSERIWNLAIYPFDITGKSEVSGTEMMVLLSTELMGMEGYSIVEREALDKALKELGLGVSDLVDPSNRTKVGRLLGAKLYCFGTLNKSLNLITARVVLTETSEQLLVMKVENKDELKGIEEIGKKLKGELSSQKLRLSLEEGSGKKPAERVGPSVVSVEVKGYGAIVDGDIVTAKELSLKDAYAKAIEQGCGVKLIRQTQVENFQLVRDKILTESVGYVTSYEIINENPNGEFGYEVTVRANVSQQPISELDKLQLMVKYLLAEPRIAVVIEGQMRGSELTKGRAGLIAGQISSQLQKAGFSVVDAQTIEEKKKEMAGLLSNEDAARLGSMLNANVIVRGSFSTEITTRKEEMDGKKLDFPIISAQTTGVLSIIFTDTANIISILDQEALPKKVDHGNTEEEAAGKSLDSFVLDSANKLAWELAAKLGEPIQLRLSLRNATMAQAERFQQQIQGVPKHLVLEAKMQRYEKGTAEYQIKTAVRSQVLQQKLMKLIDPASLGVKELVPEKVEFGTIVISLKS